MLIQLNGPPDYLQKAHLILHSKYFEGSHLSIRCTFEVDPILLSKYMERVVNPCALSDANWLTNIDNVHNWILLNSILLRVQEISLSYDVF